MDGRVGLWRRLSAEELMLLNRGVGEDSWESLGLQGDPTSPSWRRSALGVHWKDWCWSWNSNTLATWCKELTHWKRPWWWERLKAGGVGDNRGWDGWMASPTQWTWVWAGSGSWWWTGKPGVLQSMGSQSRIRLSDWTEGFWTKSMKKISIKIKKKKKICTREESGWANQPLEMNCGSLRGNTTILSQHWGHNYSRKGNFSKWGPRDQQLKWSKKCGLPEKQAAGQGGG